MNYVEFACEDRLLLRVPAQGGHVPRIGEVVVIDERPFEVVDVEYWATRAQNRHEQAAATWPTVYIVPFPADRWEQRLLRRSGPPAPATPPKRY